MADIYYESMNKIRQVYFDSVNELDNVSVETREEIESADFSITQYMEAIYKEVKILKEGYRELSQYMGYYGHSIDIELSENIALAEMKYINELLFVLGNFRRKVRLSLEELTKKVLSPEMEEYCEESDFVEYVGRMENGRLVLVSSNPEALSKELIDAENGFDESEIDGIAHQDSVNTCPECGVLYYVEDLIQLEDDIICESCNGLGEAGYTDDAIDEDGWVLFADKEGNGAWFNVIGGVLYKNVKRDEDSRERVTAPESQALLDAVNGYFGTVFSSEYFVGK